jgi:hypothetical protein
MAQASTQSNFDGSVKRAQGSFSGTYTAADFTLNVGFIPKYVMILNVTDRVKVEWWEGMNFGDYIKTAANGDTTLETDNAIEVDNVGTGDQDGAGSGTSTSIPGTKPTGSIFCDVSVAGSMTDNDTVVWEARG